MKADNFLVLLLFADYRTVLACKDRPAAEICEKIDRFKEMPDLSTRGPETVITEELFERRFCDVYAVDTRLWYRSSSLMTSSCPKMYTCSTKFPIWQKGINPRKEDGLVHLTACLRHYDSCCFTTYNVSAVNCEGTMAYCFNELPSGCHQRFCFDVHKSVIGPTNATADNVTTSNNETHPLTTSGTHFAHRTRGLSQTQRSTKIAAFILLTLLAVILVSLIIVLVYRGKEHFLVSENLSNCIDETKRKGRELKEKALSVMRIFPGGPEHSGKYRTLKNEKDTDNIATVDLTLQ